MSGSAENYLDQLTWREVGYNFCAHRDDFDEFNSLPAWVSTLREHAKTNAPAVTLSKNSNPPPRTTRCGMQLRGN